MLLDCFVVGGVLGVLGASVMEYYLLHPSVWIFVGVGLIEEAVKLAALVIVLWRFRQVRGLRAGLVPSFITTTVTTVGISRESYRMSDLLVVAYNDLATANQVRDKLFDSARNTSSNWRTPSSSSGARTGRPGCTRP